MADQLLQLTVRINSETGQLEIVNQGLQKTAQQAGETEGAFFRLGQAGQDLLKVFGVAFSAQQVLEFFQSSIQQANEDAEAIRRLSFILDASGNSWKNNSAQVSAWSEKIQETTRFSNTDALKALEGLVRVTGSLAQAQQAVQLAMGLSVASGKPLAETQQLLTNLITGNVRALLEARREFGSFIGNAQTAQDALDRLNNTFGDAASQEQGFARETAQLTNAWDDFKKSIGNEVIPVLVDLIEWTKRAVDNVRNFYQQISTLAKSHSDLIKTNVEVFKTVTTGGLNFVYDQTKKMYGQISSILGLNVQEHKTAEQQKTAATEEEGTKRVGIVAQLGQQQLLEQQRLNEELGREFVKASQSEFAEQRLKVDEEIKAARDAQLKQITISRDGMTQRISFEQYRAARFADIAKKEADDEQNKRDDALAKWKKHNEILAHEAQTTADTIATSFSKSLTDTLLRGKQFQLDMSEIFAQIIEDLIRLQIQIRLTKALQQSLGAPGSAPGAGPGLDIINGLLDASPSSPAGAPRIFGAPGATGVPVSSPGSPAAPSDSSSNPPISLTVNMNLSTDRLSVDNIDVVLKALSDKIRSETPDAITYAVRVANLANKNSSRAT